MWQLGLFSIQWSDREVDILGVLWLFVVTRPVRAACHGRGEARAVSESPQSAVRSGNGGVRAGMVGPAAWRRVDLIVTGHLPPVGLHHHGDNTHPE